MRKQKTRGVGVTSKKKKNRSNAANTETENIKRPNTQLISKADQADKTTKHNTYMKQLMQKKQADDEFRQK